MIAAPVVLAASTLAYIADGELGIGEAGGTILVYAAALFVPLIAGLTRMLEGSSPRAAAALLVTGGIGVAGCAAYAINAVYADIGPLNLNENVSSAADPLALKLPGIFFPLTLIALGVA